MLELGQVRSLRQAKDNRRANIHRPMRVISVTSGKGGVGKSSVVANLSTTLGKRGQRVLLLDGDFGLANLDIMFDLKTRVNIHSVLTGEKRIQDVIVRAAENVDIIPASSGIFEMTALGVPEKAKLLEIMQELENQYDVLFIDTGAGINEDVTWLSASAGEVIVVATPEPTSIADAYALIKVLNQKHKLKDFKLLVNQAKSDTEALRVYQQITGVSDKFLNVSIDYMGHVLWDECVSQTIRQRKSLVQAFPNAKATKNFSVLADTLCRRVEDSSATGNVQFFWNALLGNA
jgi:flagellar biosynthesis protein FlhG